MRTYNITVNGQTYVVDVEEVGTPDEIFNNPKSDKTRQFLQSIL